MKKKLPAIIVTGASGLVGRNFIAAAKEYFIIYAIARRSMSEARVEAHPNIRWIQCDTTYRQQLKEAFQKISAASRIDFVLHLAAYYDFEYTENTAYIKTNIEGTENILKECASIKPRRFIFASSIAASKFPEPGVKLNEDSPLDADYDYARSKRDGEKLVAKYSKNFPCTIVRFAAVFTDWCEYPPLYMFLKAWLSNSWNSRILGGKGQSAVPYIHVHDLNQLLLAVMARSVHIPRLSVFVASPDCSTTHQELFDMATRCYYGRRIRAIHMPKIIAVPGVWVRYQLGRLISRIPFEKPWMMRYIDLRLDMDTSRTRQALKWSPTPRYHPLRRLIIMIEKMKTMPMEWHFRNKTAMIRAFQRPNLMIYDMLFNAKDRIINKIISELRSEERVREFQSYKRMKEEDFIWCVSVFYQMIMTSVRNSDRSMLLTYAEDLARLRIGESFDITEVILAIGEMGRIINEEICSSCADDNMRLLVKDHIGMGIQLIIDEVEDVYEASGNNGRTGKQLKSCIERRLREIDSFYKP